MKGLKRWRIKNGGGWNVKGYGGSNECNCRVRRPGKCVCVWGGGGGGGGGGGLVSTRRKSG